MASAVIELIIFSLPSLAYLRKLRRDGHSPVAARAAVGWRAGGARCYGLAALVTAALLPLTYIGLDAVPATALRGSAGLHVTYGRASTAAGYAAVALLATAEEILFRGLIAGVLFRRYGFAVGNVVQAFIFLAPHALLLLVSAGFWPLLPVQFAAGWLLGLLRWRSDSIGPCSAAHVAANLLAPLLLAAGTG